MWFKTLLFLSLFAVLYFVPYFIELSPVWFLVNQFFVGVFMILSALNIGHDAMHNAFSKNDKVNYAMGLIFNLSGSNSYVWKMMHDIHHRYPNIHGYDNDISHQNIIRMSPYEKKFWFHRYQHIYVFVIALFTSFDYVFYKDYANFYTRKIGNVELPKHKLREHIILFASKAIHFTVFLVLPFLYFQQSILLILAGWVLLHVAGGYLLYFIFTPAHLVNDVDFCSPGENANIDNSWSEHQMYTTCNYGSTPFMNFFFGGLNHQIEHHLFPGICHIHYPKISKIVRATAKEFDLPYWEFSSFRETLGKNLEFLYKMGHQPELKPSTS